MVGVKVGGQGQGIGHGVKSGEGWVKVGSRSGVKVWGRVKVGVKVGVKVKGQGRGFKVRVMIGGHKVKGEAQWSRSVYRSWGQCLGSGQGLGVKVEVKVVVKVGVKVMGQGPGVKVRVIIGGHKFWGEGRGSMLGGKVRGVVRVMGRGSMSGGLGSDGQVGEVGDKQSVPLKNS